MSRRGYRVLFERELGFLIIVFCFIVIVLCFCCVRFVDRWLRGFGGFSWFRRRVVVRWMRMIGFLK